MTDADDADDTDAALDTLRNAMLGAEVVKFPGVRPDRETPRAVTAAALKKKRVRQPDPDERDDDGREDLAGGGGDDPPMQRNEHGLPAECPIVPLGKQGVSYYYLDALRQLVRLSAKDHSRNNLAALFSPYTELTQKLYARKKLVKEKQEDGSFVEQWRVVGFKVEACADELMDACARRGVWDPTKKVRGRGAWASDDGGLMLHCGHVLWTRAGEIKSGLHGGYVYPTAPPIPLPWDERVPCGEDSPAQELFDMLTTWNWQRGDTNIDAHLLLGWIGAALVGGALDWRPMVFVTGDLATGKSTIHKLLSYLFDGALVQTANTTPAGIYQHIGLDSLPIAIDEIEGNTNSERTRGVIELARLASSGGLMLRGGADHTGVEFEARSCFFFSAILVPQLEPQDRSRMAILALNALPKGRKPPVIEPDHFRSLGRKLRRRLIDQWPRLQETLFRYTQALANEGHSNRGCQQFGTLLACADLLLFDHVPEPELSEEWGQRLKAESLRETAQQRSNAESCLDFLCQSQPEAWRGGSKSTVAELVGKLVKPTPGGNENSWSAEEALRAAGLAVVCPRKGEGAGRTFLAVPDKHRQVAKLFEGSSWESRPNLEGLWAQALARLAGVVLHVPQKIAGHTERCTLVPAELVASEDPQVGDAAGAGVKQEETV